MKKLITDILLSIGLIFCLTCCNSTSMQEIIINNQYNIKIPTYMSETTSLNQEAILQYQNEFKSIYMIVLEDKKKDMQILLAEYKTNLNFDSDFDKYADYMIENRGFAGLSNQKINGLNAKILKITRMVNGTQAYFNIALFEGKNHYYQIITWSAAGKEAKNRGDMELIVNSFTENNF